PNLRRAPIRIVTLEPDDLAFDHQRQLIRVPVRATTPVRQPVDPVLFVAVVNLVAGLARNAELRAQRRHLLAIEQAGDEPETLVFHVTLLPGHAPSSGAKCHPCLRNETVTPLSGRAQCEFTDSPVLDGRGSSAIVLECSRIRMRGTRELALNQ